MTTDKEDIINGTFTTLTTTVDIPTRRVCDLLITAFEGGSNYWYTKLDYELPEGITYRDFRKGGKFTDPGIYRHPLEIIPFVEGCALTLQDAEGDSDTVYRIDRAALLKGLELLSQSKQLQHHWQDFINENEDALTADTYLQLVVFGKVIYG